jgi:ribosomal protein S19E (S16A)
MQQYDWFIPESGDLLQALAGSYYPELQAAIESSPYEGWDITAGQMAQAAGDAPLTVEHMLARIPYMSAQAARKQLDTSVERGMLEATDGGYRLSAAGRSFVEGLVDRINRSLRAQSAKLPQAERLVDLLGRQVEGISAAPGIEAPSLLGSRTFDPGPSASAPERLRRYLQDLNAWRDDAHVAAWRQHEPDGHAWEVFSHVWGEKVWGDPVTDASQAAEKLGFRGYGEAEYGAALESLRERGWLERDEAGYRISAAGRSLREAAEAATDQHYFAPWKLDASEADELRQLMAAAKEALTPETVEA